MNPSLPATWYPGDAQALSATVDDYIGAADRLDHLKAVIAPHAGYRYSGPVAGSAYAQVAAVRERIDRVVLVGPSHHVGFRGLAVSGAAQFRTPLGDVPIDRDAVHHLLSLPFVQEVEAAHAPRTRVNTVWKFICHPCSAPSAPFTWCLWSPAMRHRWRSPKHLPIFGAGLKP